MIGKLIPAFIACLCIGCGTSTSIQSVHPSADTLFINGTVITVDESSPNAEAVAVTGGKIVAVGSNEALSAFKGTATEVVDLAGKPLLPGFICAHGHIGYFGIESDYANLAPTPVGQVNDFAALKQTLKQYIKDRQIPPGQWVVGAGYDDSLLAEGQHPTRAELDEVSTEHPIFIFHISHHLAVLNSKGLELAGIDAQSVAPEGSVIQRISGSMEPNGVLEETILLDVFHKIPPNSMEKTLQLFEDAQNIYASYGITTAQEGTGGAFQAKALMAAAEQDRLKIDILFFPEWTALDKTLETGMPPREYVSRAKLAGVKMYLDGSPQGKTAWLTQPYHVPPKGLDNTYKGYATFPDKTVEEALQKLFADGWHVLAHANGDAAADQLINSIAKVTEGQPKADRRTVMIHAQTARDDQLDRMNELSITPSFFVAHTYYWGDWHRDSVLGKERAYRISPAQSALQKGVPFTFHNDSPVVPPNISYLLWNGVNRYTRSGDVLGEAQRVSPMDAIRAVTINAAWQYFEEDRKGSISAGKLADLVVLSDNPLTVDPNAIKDIKVLSTYKEGVKIYQR